ncbi:virulence factor TspB C-terminal domain-related protein [Acinetobacter towneri]|uniref:virulence factor TspB C-terminal domain-related protein n=1 Tax=Acinetobacter towneri TaxID=202956 RepID=UPI002096F695|nr:virulence factor TspB C-terminal domain-related protein [Acinetobacter towneri]MCO8060332.1 hypothetical protein [Acinetobacter towneri]MCO8065982.1 hypothetical protein [Acinetobacter towneri]
MYSDVDNGWGKTVLKQFIKILLCFTLIYTPFFAFAGAAEKWDYEVDPIPDRNQRVVVTGHKVDQFGDAVNDSKYKTTIDPKTYSNKQKMGGVAIAKLLKKANWASVGVEAFQKLLEGIDWVMDPASQSIWRYKQGNDNYSCSYTRMGVGGVNLIKRFKGANGETSFCPYEMALSRLADRQTWPGYAGYTLSFVKWDPELKSDSSVFRFQFKSVQNSTGHADFYFYDVPYDEIEHQPSTEKEYLTPQAAADYANKTHPDYNNPAYKPKLDENYKPEIVPNLWKPHNEWEKTNSPTAQEVVRQLEQSNPTSENKDIEQKTDEEGNPTGSFSLPEFCSWATPVCDFIKWVKDNPENEDEAPEIPQEIDIGTLDTGTFKATAGCPAPIQVPVNLGTGGNVEISYEPICQFASKWSFVAPLIGFLSGAMILVGVGRKGEDGEI